MPEQTPPPVEAFRHLILAFRVTQAIYVAAELGIADLLAGGPCSADDLAAAAGAHGPSLHRVLRLLASEGVFAETGDGRFILTPMAALLRRDALVSLRPLVVLHGTQALWRSWGHLLHSVRTGEPAFDQVHGVDFFGYFRQHPDERAVFDQAMAAQTAAVTRAVAAAYDFAPIGTVVHVGGGNGALAIGLLASYEHLQGIVFDQPAVVADARAAIAAAGLSGRCVAVGGDFFTAVPAGGDAYLLKYILHDWEDAHCVAILPPRDGGRLLVVELQVSPGDGRSFAKSQDVNMLVNLGGRERTAAEYRALFAAAGFALTRTIPAQDEPHVLEGAPA